MKDSQHNYFTLKCQHLILTQTKCAVQPEMATLALMACTGASCPLKEGSREGGTLIIFPSHFLTNPPENLVVNQNFIQEHITANI